MLSTPVNTVSVTGNSQLDEKMETPHFGKVAAHNYVHGAELGQLSVNPKNGTNTSPFNRPLRVRLGNKTAKPCNEVHVRRASQL